MLNIRKIRIKNFKSMNDLELVFANDKHLLVGSNNSGKSNILKAINYVFSGSNIANESDIYAFREVEEETYIDVMLIPDTIDKKIPSKWFNVIDGENIIENEFGEESFSIRCVIKENESNGMYDVQRFPIMDWNTQQFEIKNKTLNRNFRKCIQAYYVTSSRDIVSELRIKSSNFSKLLKNSNISLNKQDKEIIEKQLNDVNNLIISKLPDISLIESKLSEISTTLDNLNKVTILPIPNKLNDLDKGVEISIEENRKNLPIDIYGDGTRSWISILSLKSFVELQHHQNSLEGLPFSPILLIEEPESHLHPQAQNKVLKQLSEFGSTTIVTTHSTNIVSQSEKFDIFKVKRKNKRTLISSFSKEDFETKKYYNIKNLIIPYHTEMLFAETVLIVEGLSDKIFIGNYMEYKTGKKPFDYGIEIVCGDSYNGIPLLQLFCEEMSINSFIFSDKDHSNDVVSKLESQGLKSDILRHTEHDELEDDILKENFETIKNMYSNENFPPNLKAEEKNEIIIKKFKRDKKEYPYTISDFFNEDFSVKSLDDLFDYIIQGVEESEDI